MRIVGGTLGGRRFDGPPSDLTRPTAERVREALASALDARDALRGARVLDLYTGTGALAFEALSRGAEHAVLIDHNPRVVKAALHSAKSLDLAQRVRVLRADLGAPPATRERSLYAALRPYAPFSLVFADPPYDDVAVVPPLLDDMVEQALIDPSAVVVLEHRHALPPPACARLAPLAVYRYGDTGVRLLTVT
ncbi:MAG: RsmD family RNA methyltransferase [Polyangiales bacterium]|nr:RsmD family RNA methyltransferase [Myxococcales bacterium]MCB9656415.1 RsmD family RNA methyltransferase [Sandaracinaceae bacterium]